MTDNGLTRDAILQRAGAIMEGKRLTFTKVQELLCALRPENFARALDHNAKQLADKVAEYECWEKVAAGLTAGRKLSDIRLDLELQAAPRPQTSETRAATAALKQVREIEARHG